MKSHAYAGMLFAFGLLFRWDAYGQLVTTPVVLSRAAAPGTGNGITFSSFQDVHIDDSGRVLFVGTLTGPGTTSTNRHGIWTGWPGNLELVARTGDEAPDTQGGRFVYFGKPAMDGAAGAIFYATYRPPGSGASLATPPGVMENAWQRIPPETIRQMDKVFQENMQAKRQRLCRELKTYNNITSPLSLSLPGFGFYPAFVNIAEKIKAKAEILPAQADALGAPRDGIVVSSTNGFLGGIFVGDRAPGTTNTLASLDQLAMTVGTNLAFTGTLTSSGKGLWFGPPDNFQPVILPNAPVPPSLAAEFGSQARFGNDVYSLGLSAGNYLGCVAQVAGPGSAKYAVLAGPRAGLRVISRERSSSSEPGFIIFDKLVLNSSGDVAFTASHTALGGIPGLTRGLWMTHRLSAPFLAFAEGQTTSGLTNGEVISFFEEGPYLNRLGQVAMRAGIGPAVGFENTRDKGLWLIDPVRGAQLVARGGTMIDIGGGQTRRLFTNAAVAFISSHDVLFSGGDDGRPTPFNNFGQVVFIAQWQETNGAFRSGVFIAGEVRVLQPIFQGNDAFVCFPTRAGKQYRVEYRENFTAAPWNVLADLVPGTGGIVTVTNSGAALLPKRFYQTVLLP